MWKREGKRKFLYFLARIYLHNRPKTIQVVARRTLENVKMLPGSIVLPVTTSDIFRALRLPTFSILVGLFVLLPGFIVGRQTATIPLVFALMMLAIGVGVIVLEIMGMKTSYISYNDDGITLISGKHEITVPWFAVENVKVLNLIPKKGGRSVVRSAVEVAVTKEGAEYVRTAPEIFHALDIIERESIALFLGTGAKRQEYLDSSLRNAGVRRYEGVTNYPIDNRRIRYAMDPSSRVRN